MNIPCYNDKLHDMAHLSRKTIRPYLIEGAKQWIGSRSLLSYSKVFSASHPPLFHIKEPSFYQLDYRILDFNA